MSVRTALQRINEILDEVLNEQEGDFDADTRFAIAWFRQHGFDRGPYGDADNLARARNASLDHLQRAGILTKGGGHAALVNYTDLDDNYDPAADPSISVWEVVMHLTKRFASGASRKRPRFSDRCRPASTATTARSWPPCFFTSPRTPSEPSSPSTSTRSARPGTKSPAPPRQPRQHRHSTTPELTHGRVAADAALDHGLRRR